MGGAGRGGRGCDASHGGVNDVDDDGDGAARDAHAVARRRGVAHPHERKERIRVLGKRIGRTLCDRRCANGETRRENERCRWRTCERDGRKTLTSWTERREMVHVQKCRWPDLSHVWVWCDKEVL